MHTHSRLKIHSIPRNWNRELFLSDKAATAIGRLRILTVTSEPSCPVSFSINSWTNEWQCYPQLCKLQLLPSKCLNSEFTAIYKVWYADCWKCQMTIVLQLYEQEYGWRKMSMCYTRGKRKRPCSIISFEHMLPKFSVYGHADCDQSSRFWPTIMLASWQERSSTNLI